MRVDLRILKKLLAEENAGTLLAGFEERRRNFEARLRKARRSPSERAIHNLRVASRRLLSMLALLETVVPRQRVAPLRKQIKTRLQALRATRDVQVQRVYVDGLLKDFPQLTAFQKFLSRKEKRLTKRSRKDLKKFELKQVRKRTERLLDRLIESIDPETDVILGRKLWASVDDAFRKVISLRARIDPELPKSIHSTRLAFKKFRYMAEIVAPSFDELTPERLGAMHDFQDRMGVIQDIDSLLASMMDYRRQSGRTSLLVAENEIRRQRQRLSQEFSKSADEVRFFWSASLPDARLRETARNGA